MFNFLKSQKTKLKEQLEIDKQRYNEKLHAVRTLVAQKQDEANKFNKASQEAGEKMTLPVVFEARESKRSRANHFFFVYEGLVFNSRDIKTFFLRERGEGQTVTLFEGKPPVIKKPAIGADFIDLGEDPEAILNESRSGVIELVYQGGSLFMDVDPFWSERLYKHIVEEWKKTYD